MDGGAPGRPDALRASPTGRVPQWVLDEAAGRPTADEGWREWTPGEQQPRRRRRRRMRGLLAVLVVLVVALGAAWLANPGLLAGDPPVAQPALPGPPPGQESTEAPLGAPPPAPATGGTHAFVALQPDGTGPVAFDPCRPIHYVIRPDNAPVGGELLLHEAFARVTAATGLQFVYDGATEEPPAEKREPYQPDRYGDRWAPVLVSWQTGEENPDFVGDVAGEAGSHWRSVGTGPQVYVTGGVALDSAFFAELLASPDGYPIARAIVLHEIGHLVGLDHVDDPAQLMFPTASGGILDFSAGDLTGLSALGAGTCVPDL
ncbi:matrixin family metalloprotease [Blastococcus saxobsidens]|uniref:matrixin family metalloprotease n=1 Tax=Blastococcus saxobsidens TaxID=138336 RepID=UPI0031F30398